MKETVLPLCVIDLTEKVAEDVDYAITVEDLTAWEEIMGDFLMIVSLPFGQNWSNEKAKISLLLMKRASPIIRLVVRSTQVFERRTNDHRSGSRNP